MKVQELVFGYPVDNSCPQIFSLLFAFDKETGEACLKHLGSSPLSKVLRLCLLPNYSQVSEAWCIISPNPFH